MDLGRDTKKMPGFFGRYTASSRPPDIARKSPREVLFDPRLWITLVMVFALVGFWKLVVTSFGQNSSSTVTNFLPLAVFLIPVLYGAVSFGLFGGLLLSFASAIATVLWAVLVPSTNDLVGTWYDLVQALILVVIGYFVGKGVSAERDARIGAERSRQNHLLAEARYRELFETNSQPILLIDELGRIHEANRAAKEMFADVGEIVGKNAGKVLGAELLEAIEKQSDSGVHISAPVDDPLGATVLPIARSVVVDGASMTQVVVQDITEQARKRRRAQVYAADVVGGQEEERHRIAQELHDGPLQTLVHVCRLIDRLASFGEKSQDPTNGSKDNMLRELRELRSSTEAVIAEVRQISSGLRPTMLDDLGFEPALKNLCDEIEKRAGIAVSLRITKALPRVSDVLELSLYRIAQEALSNVDHHAQATTVEVECRFDTTLVHLSVTDDGVGFVVPSDLIQQRGSVEMSSLGLLGMAERAELVGGKIDLKSKIGIGTVVTVTIPVA